LNPNSTGQATVTFSSMGTRAAGSAQEINGAFGGTPGVDNTSLIFTTAPSGSNFIGGGGAVTSTTASVIPWLRPYENISVYGYDPTKGVTSVVTTSSITAGSTANVALSTTPTLSGDTTINSLQMGGNSVTMASYTLTVTSGVITQGINGTIGNDASSANWGTLAFGSAEGELTVAQARTLTINSVITGTGGLTFVGNYVNSGSVGKLVLNGTNTYTGLTSFYGSGANAQVYLNNSLALQDTTLNYTNSNGGNGSTVNFGNGGTNGQTTYTFGGLEGNLNITLANGNTTVQGVNLTIGSAGDSTSTTYSGVLSGTTSGNGLTKAGSGTLTLSGASTYNGTTAINGGIVNLGIAQNGTTSGPLGAGASTQAINFGGGTLQYSSVNNTDYSARVAAGTSTGAISIDTNGQAVTFATALTSSQSGGLTESDTAGGGSLTLTAANGYTGGTTINSGAIRANNTTGSATGGGAVAVNSGGTLGGSGTIGNGTNAITVASGGILTAGANATTIGTLTTGAQTWNGGGKLLAQLASSNSSDLVNITSAGSAGLTLASSTGTTPFTVTESGTAGSLSPTTPETWTLATFTGSTTGTPSGYTGALPAATPGATVPVDSQFMLDTSTLATLFKGSETAAPVLNLEYVSSTEDALQLSYNGTPEPGTAMLVLGGALPMLTARRRRRNRNDLCLSSMANR